MKLTCARTALLAVLFACSDLSPRSVFAEAFQPTAWPNVGGDLGGARYSPLRDIHRGNVKNLRVAWTYRHEDYRAGWLIKPLQGTAFEATPLLVEDLLVFNTPFSRVIALDPETGAEGWSFDPRLDRGQRFHSAMVSRGVAFWGGDTTRNEHCGSRIFLATLDARLIALERDYVIAYTVGQPGLGGTEISEGPGFILGRARNPAAGGARSARRRSPPAQAADP